MFHLLGIFNAGSKPDAPGREAPFDEKRDASAHEAYSKAECDEAFLTCKCPEPRATPEDKPSQLRFVKLFAPPYF